MFVSSLFFVISIVFDVTIGACQVDPAVVKSGVQTHTHTVGDTVRFDCNKSNNISQNQMVWHRTTLNGSQLEVLYAGLIGLGSESINHIGISAANYSLLLKSITTDDEGAYICKICGQTVANYRLRVITALPELQIQYGGTNVTGTILVEKGKTIQLDCVVFRAIEEPVILWQVENTILTEHTEETVKSSNQFIEGTFDFTKTLTYLIENDTELVCSSFENSRINISVTISSDQVDIADLPKVLPELRIQRGGKNVTNTILVDNGTKVSLDCVVFRASEEPIIVWQVENTTLTEHTQETYKSSNQFLEGTFDFRKTLTYSIEKDTKLTCASLGKSSINITVTTIPRMPWASAKSPTYETHLIAAVCLIALIASVVAVSVYMKRCRETRRSTSIRKKRSSNGGPIQESVPLQRCQPDREASRNKSTRTLPEVPKGEESYAHKLNEEDHYSEMSYNLPSGDVFSRQRICMIHKLSDGVICERWIGNVTTTRGEKKYAFISCLKGVIRSRHFQWEGLVKKISELPECPHIFRAQGICLDEPHLFLLQDYKTCETLTEYVSMKINRQDAGKDQTEFFGKKFTDISLQVTYGMEFIITHGLSHPGLSVKKILINEDGVCKLYDFCLAEDAPKFMECLKLEADFKPSSHPQECVARNEYTRASDVWYTAFTIREIYSYGSQQHPLGSSLYYANSSTCSLPSGLCPPSVCKRLTECLTQNYNERAMNLKELLKALKSDGYFTHVEAPKTTYINKSKDNQSYEPMHKGDEAYSMPLLGECTSTSD